MQSVVKILPHYTYEEYCQWEGRWELIDCIPYAMTPTPLPTHQWVSNNIKYELKDAIKKSGCKQCKVYDFIDIKVSEDTIVQQDAVVVCKDINKPFLDFTAALVVEVLSPSTALKDHNNKLFISQSQKIPYFIIIDLDKNEIEIYHLNEGGQYRLEKVSPTLPYTFYLDECCTAKVILDNIWE